MQGLPFAQDILYKVISNILIENYKSITNLPLELGRVNVFIGENGAGKSNLLEAIALAGAAAARKLDNEFLVSRGIRVTRPIDMRPAFAGSDPSSPISVRASAKNGGKAAFSIHNDNETYSKWTSKEVGEVTVTSAKLVESFRSIIESIDTNKLNPRERNTLTKVSNEVLERLLKTNSNTNKDRHIHSLSLENIESSAFANTLMSKEDRDLRAQLSKFVIYSPENSALRTPQREGQIEPLGINGEGVSRMFSFYVNQANNTPSIAEEVSQRAATVLSSLDRSLRVLGWFDGIRLAKEKQDEMLEIHDAYIEEEDRYFEFASANEGFFFLLFYFLLFSSDLTPPFFAIDNIDASLNPGLCRALASQLVKLAKENDKQAILTTHNPAILDGLDLDDDDQRLFVVRRKLDGETRVDRVTKPRNSDTMKNLKMSEAFMRGLIGGLPATF